MARLNIQPIQARSSQKMQSNACQAYSEKTNTRSDPEVTQSLAIPHNLMPRGREQPKPLALGIRSWLFHNSRSAAQVAEATCPVSEEPTVLPE